MTLSRRDFIDIAARSSLLGVPMLDVASAALGGGSAPTAKPNIIYILADDMGYGDLGCQNPESKIPTPNMDRLAGQGMRFTDAHSGSAVCTPTRYGVLTGRYCWRSPMKSGVLWGYSPPLIEPDRPTVAGLLKDNGYSTACVGKWHLGLDWQAKAGMARPAEDNSKTPGDWVDFAKPYDGGPNELGFDYYHGISASLDMHPYVYLENDRATAVPTLMTREGGRLGLTAEGFKAVNVLGDLTRKSTEWIEQQATDSHDDPFFLYFPLNAPHTPVVPSEPFQGKSDAGSYGDFVVEVDSTVGQIIETLERLGIADNTLLIVTSDNGPESHMVERKRVHNHDSSRPLRGMKRDTWDGGHRIPFLARWPGKIEPGTTSDQTTCLTDLFATCGDVIGEPVSPPDSVSILPALLGADAGQPLREATVHHSARGEFAIRQGDWKLILCQGAPTSASRRTSTTTDPTS